MRTHFEHTFCELFSPIFLLIQRMLDFHDFNRYILLQSYKRTALYHSNFSKRTMPHPWNQFEPISLTFQELLSCLDVISVWTAFLELCPVFVTLFQIKFGAIVATATMNQCKVVARDVFVAVTVLKITSKKIWTKLNEKKIIPLVKYFFFVEDCRRNELLKISC